MGVFTNAESAERIMYGVTEDLNTNWGHIPFGKFNRTLDVTRILAIQAGRRKWSNQSWQLVDGSYSL